MPPSFSKKGPFAAANAANAGTTASAQPTMPSMTTAQAFSGLHLHDNPELADALEFFVRGYINCADTENLGYVPRSCTDQTLKTFEHHESWADGDGSFPWDRLDRAWKHAAMQKLVYHIRDGPSLAGRAAAVAFTVLPGIGRTQGGEDGHRARLSIEEVDDGPVGSIVADEAGSAANFENPTADNDHDEPNPFKNVKAKGKATAISGKKTGRTPFPAARADFPWGIPSSASTSPTQHIAVRRHNTVQAASSSSPLLSLPRLPSSSLRRHKESILADVAAARAASSSSSSSRRQTRASTFASSIVPSNNAATIARGGVKKQKQQQSRKSRAAPAHEDDKLFPFEDILDSRVNGDDVEYRVKWTSGRPTWQPSLDLEDAPEEVAAFHDRFPGKVGPPEWFVRGVARARTEGEGEEEDGEEE